jgi:hypothetical protein
VYRWTLNHIVEVSDLKELEKMFPIDIVKY